MSRLTLLLASLVILFSSGIHVTAGVITYSNSAAFAAATPGAETWHFEGLSGQYEDLSGPGTISLNDAQVKTGSGFEHLFNNPLSGNCIVINPQAASYAGDIHFRDGATSFGFDSLWSNSFSVQNVTLHLYDASNRLIGDVALTPQTPGVQGPINTGYGFSMYQGFIGFTSSTPVSRIQITQQGGATYYYNFRWNEAPGDATVPEPSTMAVMGVFGGLLGLYRKRKSKTVAA